MKKIVNGLVYNTETADWVGEHVHSGPGDFSYYVEQLYRSPKGRFFLVAWGGAGSPYSRRIGQSEFAPRGEDEAMFLPLSTTDAKLWAEIHLSPARYLEFFGADEA